MNEGADGWMSRAHSLDSEWLSHYLSLTWIDGDMTIRTVPNPYLYG